jgi:hypothetical protein
MIEGSGARVLAVSLLLVAAGCAESEWTYTLNPDGSGKVKVSAVVQPLPPGSLALGDLDGEGPEDFARRCARNILDESRGLASWSHVSWGLADDGRVKFAGTAYFRELYDVSIKGTIPLTLIGTPFLEHLDDGRLLVCIGVPGVLQELRVRAGEAPITDFRRIPQGPMQGKMLWQSVKPFASSLLGTMKTTVKIRACSPRSGAQPEGAATVEVLNVTLDGPAVLAAAERMAREDPAGLTRRPEIPEDEGRSGGAAAVHVHDVLFGTTSVANGIIDPTAGPAFDFEGELAEAQVSYERLAADLTLPPEPLGPRYADTRLWWGFAGGAVAAARTDSGAGVGWSGAFGWGSTGQYPDGLLGHLEISHVDYEDEDGIESGLSRFIIGGAAEGRHYRGGGGLAYSFGDGDIWSSGLQLYSAVGSFSGHGEISLQGAVYAWFGERDDEFDFDVEADVRLVAGLRF